MNHQHHCQICDIATDCDDDECSLDTEVTCPKCEKGAHWQDTAYEAGYAYASGYYD